MSYRSAPIFLALLLMFLSGACAVGWVLHIQALVQPIPGLVASVFNTAICFFCLGLTLLILQRTLGYQQNLLCRALLLFIFILSTFSLLQDALHLNFGIDQLIIKPWFQDPNPTPGRMAPNTSVAFILSGLTGFLLPYGHKKIIAIIIQTFTGLILLIALLGILIYSLKLDLVFPGYAYTRMALQTATGFLIVSIALWSLWIKSAWYKKFYAHREDKKIVLTIGVTLCVLSLIVGLGGTTTLAYTHLSSLEQHLALDLKDKIDTVMDEVNQSYEDTLSFTQLPALMKYVEHNAQVQPAILKEIADYSVEKNFSALNIEDRYHHSFLQTGRFVTHAVLALPLSTHDQTLLYFKNKFFVTLSLPIIKNKETIGYLVTETPLDAVNEFYKNYKALGDTGEIRLCQKTKNNTMICFPSRWRSTVFNGSLINSTPMSHALQGKTGIIDALDYRHQAVVAAYAPITTLDLGMVIKVDKVEFYHPLRNELSLFFPAATLFIFLGLVILYWQISPLVRALLSSQRKLMHTNNQLERSLTELHQTHLEVSLLREFNVALQLCLTPAEVATAVTKHGAKILPHLAGIFYTIDHSHHEATPAATWGHPLAQAETFTCDQCLGLRQGALYKVENAKKDLRCPHIHLQNKQNFSSFCIPLLTQDHLLGLLYLETKKHAPILSDINHYHAIAIAFSEQIALCLSGIFLHETLREQTFIDPLTGLHNRRFLDEMLDKELQRAARQGYLNAILMLDIDHFKNVNDKWGHLAGDNVLAALADCIRHHIRPYDIACRYGGEEFLIVLCNLSPSAAFERAETLRNAIQALTLQSHTGEPFAITVSIGLALYPQNGDTAQAVIHAADLALYQAKNTGRNKTVAYTTTPT